MPTLVLTIHRTTPTRPTRTTHRRRNSKAWTTTTGQRTIPRTTSFPYPRRTPWPNPCPRRAIHRWKHSSLYISPKSPRLTPFQRHITTITFISISTRTSGRATTRRPGSIRRTIPRPRPATVRTPPIRTTPSTINHNGPRLRPRCR